MPIEHLPPAWRPPARRLRDWLRTDAGIMLILAGFFLTRAVAHASKIRLPPHTHLLEQLMPPWLLTTVWVAIGMVLVAAAVTQASRWSRWALAIAVGWCAAWSVFTLLTPFPTFERFGAPHACIALLVMHSIWKGRSGEIRMRGTVSYGKRA